MKTLIGFKIGLFGALRFSKWKYITYYDNDFKDLDGGHMSRWKYMRMIGKVPYFEDVL